MKSEFNPSGIIQIGDPFVLRAKDGCYYMYATSHTIDMMGFKVWKSKDLKHWDDGKVCYQLGEKSFGYCDCWAPEVTEYNGKYYMFYSARWKETKTLRLGVAVSTSPEEPFEEAFDNRPLFDFGYTAIDGSVFIDDDGQKYLYYSRDCNDNIENGEHQSHLYVIRLSDDLLSVVGEPVCITKPEKEYEIIPHINDEGVIYKWNEGPFMVKVNGEYHLMYSGNFFTTKYYCICGAKSKSPMGPFEKYDAPIATHIEGKVSDPGHNSMFKDEKGQMYCAYHVHTELSKPGNNRQRFIDKLNYENGKLTMKITYND